MISITITWKAGWSQRLVTQKWAVISGSSGGMPQLHRLRRLIGTLYHSRGSLGRQNIVDEKRSYSGPILTLSVFVVHWAASQLILTSTKTMQWRMRSATSTLISCVLWYVDTSLFTVTFLSISVDLLIFIFFTFLYQIANHSIFLLIFLLLLGFTVHWATVIVREKNLLPVFKHDAFGNYMLTSSQIIARNAFGWKTSHYIQIMA